MITPILAAEELSVHYADGGGSLLALEQVTFDIFPQEFISVVGPSGCGKSTLLKVLAGLVPPSAGRVYFDGEVCQCNLYGNYLPVTAELKLVRLDASTYSGGIWITRNGVPLRQLGERVAIDIAYGGSCTAGKRADFDYYHAVLSWAARRSYAVMRALLLACRARGAMRSHSSSRSSVFCRADACFSSIARRCCF